MKILLSLFIASTQAMDNLRGSNYEIQRNLENNNYKYYWYNDDFNNMGNDDLNNDDFNNSSSYEDNNNGYGNNVDYNETDDYYNASSNSTADTSSNPYSNSNLTDTVHQIQDLVVNQVQTYKAAAEAKGYEVFQTAPSEWTSSQWEFVGAWLGGLILTCCLATVCCACCCARRSKTDEQNEAVTVAMAEYHKRMLNHRLNRHRARYNEKQYDNDDDDTDDYTYDDTNGTSYDETLYTVDSQSTYDQESTVVSTVVSKPETPKSVESSVYFDKHKATRERRRREKEAKRANDRRAQSRSRDDKREALLDKKNSERRCVSRDKRKSRSSSTESKKKEEVKDMRETFRETLIKKTSNTPLARMIKIAETPARRASKEMATREIATKEIANKEIANKETSAKEAAREASLKDSAMLHPSSTSSTPVRATNAKGFFKEDDVEKERKKEDEEKEIKAVDEALNYKMHP